MDCNLGVIPRNGRGMTWKELGEASRAAYNLSPTLSKQVPWLTAKLIYAGRDWNETMTLDDLNAHGAIEHDASYTRTCFIDFQINPNLSHVRRGYPMAA
jgi:hypothetical protein